jgi:hypothetical protein
MVIPSIPYKIIEMVSDDKPLRSEMSSETTFVNTPGALSLLSNHEISLYIIPLKSFFLIVRVRFSPT